MKESRKTIENIGSTNLELFIEKVNQAYGFNYDLVSQLEEVFSEKPL